MGEPSVAMKELAQRLVAGEERRDSKANPGKNAAVRVIEKLQVLLTRFSGSEGCSALLRRAVALSRIHTSSFEGPALSPDASISSFIEMSDEDILTLMAHLLELMNTFIGKALTLTLISEVYPLDK
ncbi:MAG: hypothetical protein H7Y17_12305 [Chlorobia bacterium]|nr:hypothetical protein [Fimbriimonadaceae bacterium]